MHMRPILKNVSRYFEMSLFVMLTRVKGALIRWISFHDEKDFDKLQTFST